MAPEIDILATVDAVRTALPDATPNPAALMFLAQVPYIGTVEAVSVVEQICDRFPPGAWYFDDERFSDWPARAIERAVDHVRRLPRGWQRVYAFGCVAEHLTEGERQEALDGILDGTLSSGSRAYNKPTSFTSTEMRLVRRMSAASREAWLRAQHGGGDASIRAELGPLGEQDVRDLYARACQENSIPNRLLPHLPEDLREDAIRRARSESTESVLRVRARLGDLGDEELRRLLKPPEEGTHYDFLMLEDLFDVAPRDVPRAWLDAFESRPDYSLQTVVGRLLPRLEGEDRVRAEKLLRQSLVRAGENAGPDNLWSLVGEDELGPLLMRMRCDAYGWHRDGLIEHIVGERAPETVERSLVPLISILPQLPPDHRLEIVAAMTPWLARETGGELPAALAGLRIEASGRSENDQWMIARVLGKVEAEP